MDWSKIKKLHADADAEEDNEERTLCYEIQGIVKGILEWGVKGNGGYKDMVCIM
jgi:hypothetical protein